MKSTFFLKLLNNKTRLIFKIRYTVNKEKYMTLRQLLLTGKLTDMKFYFRAASSEALIVLIAAATHIQAFPEEMQTKETFLKELNSLAPKDFGGYNESARKALEKIAKTSNWEELVKESIEVINSCS